MPSESAVGWEFPIYGLIRFVLSKTTALDRGYLRSYFTIIALEPAGSKLPLLGRQAFG
jgi:hypothetical protein